MEKRIPSLPKIFFLLTGPTLFLLMISVTGFFPEKTLMLKVTGVALWMITWWISEAVPLPVTALLPLTVFPLLEIFDIKSIAIPYANPIIFLFMGGFLIALAIEKHGLHERVALWIIAHTGTGATKIILGFMMATAFTSMWISNTATTVMMLPIANSVLQLSPNRFGENKGPLRKFGMLLMLSIAYAANIGGTATIIGTPPNVVLVGLLKESYGYQLGFLTWMIFGVPFSLILLLLGWLMITRFLPHRLKGALEAKEALEARKNSLGKIRPSEKAAAGVFLLTAFFWICGGFLNVLLEKDIFNDTVTALAGGMLMFIIPAEKNKRILEWQDTQKLAWGILLLFGGGLALAKALDKAGVIAILGESIQNLGSAPVWLLALILSGIILFLTEIMSNVALTTVFVPVVFSVSGGFGIDPKVLAIPVTLAASCAFMMPVATPPNAIVFSSGYIRPSDMMRIGLLLNLISLTLLTAGVWLYGLFLKTS